MTSVAVFHVCILQLNELPCVPLDSLGFAQRVKVWSRPHLECVVLVN